MDNENMVNVILEPLLFDKDCFSDPGVKELQEALFPAVNTPKINNAGGFLTNFLLKFTGTGQEERAGDTQFTYNKDPKDLFSIIKEPGTAIQSPRWPTECQVLEERIRHIQYVPPSPHPYYNPSGDEIQPKPVGEECGIIVYQYYPISAVNYFSRSSIGGSRYLLPTCPCPEQEGLRFESRFECGNLAKAIRITSTFYELHLRTDLYTNKHMQWFYFRVKNTRKEILYRFSIVNMTKDGSLFNEGLKPLLYSEKDANLFEIGWRRFGNNITYFCNDNNDSNDEDQQNTYTLTFTFEFPHDDDVCYFAYSYPYTYSDLQDYLLELSNDPYKSSFTTLRLLCKTLAGNNVYYITITSQEENTKKSDVENEENVKEGTKKKAVVITARVHPGETPSSWMMKGFLDFLTSDNNTAKELRDKFIFKLVPMLNPDGVIVGNNRCSLTGRDLNRQYRTVIRETYPSIWYTKLMIRRLLEECGVAMYCDLHAHSRKHNIFVYGCENRRGQEKKLHEQVFPLMLRKNTPDKFSFEDCKFRVQKNKEGTGRIVMWMMGIQNSYTMEASFGGSLMGGRAETHFTTQDYEQMGKFFCQTLLDFCDEDPRKERLRVKIIERLLKEGSNADEPTNIVLSDYSSDDGETSSSSSDEGGGPSDNYISVIVPPPTPEMTKKNIKPKTCKISKLNTKPKAKTASAKPQRRTITMSTSNINLPSNYNGSSSGSDSDEDSSEKETTTLRRPKKHHKKKKRKKKKKKEVEEQEEVPSPKTLSVLDILSFTKFRSINWNRSTPKLASVYRTYSDYKITKSASLQLAEVQVKLLSLQNRLWMGAEGDMADEPLSWGPSNIYPPNRTSSEKTVKQKKKTDKKNEEYLVN
ncbi:cytosolic carboxypeptidase Nna1-like [Agrilus planipennis]|uniref:Cytosolic carboxypeptidase Nna1-like n=1 Tax=Agrilus planipennis TaxID=224129 RepID=A0A1W4XUR7_AGRPL|nr:cytosolic carboxypeptidase Nna1-like [Agrilus planipennis]